MAASDEFKQHIRDAVWERVSVPIKAVLDQTGLPDAIKSEAEAVRKPVDRQVSISPAAL
jgi:hypothetical protein